MYCIVLYCIVLYCIVLYCIVLHCIALHCIVLYCIVLYCIVLYCIVLYCTALHCTALHCIALHCIVSYHYLWCRFRPVGSTGRNLVWRNSSTFAELCRPLFLPFLTLLILMFQNNTVFLFLNGISSIKFFHHYKNVFTP